MAKIDRLGWAAGIAFDAFGASIGVGTNDPAFLELLMPHFPPGWKARRSVAVDWLYSFRVGGTGRQPSVRHFHLLYENLEQRARTLDLEEAIDSFARALRGHVATAATRRVIVHGGVVGWRSRAIVCAGRTFTGKTSLVAELVRSGATY